MNKVLKFNFVEAIQTWPDTRWPATRWCLQSPIFLSVTICFRNHVLFQDRFGYDMCRDMFVFES